MRRSFCLILQARLPPVRGWVILKASEQGTPAMTLDLKAAITARLDAQGIDNGA